MVIQQKKSAFASNLIYWKIAVSIVTVKTIKTHYHFCINKNKDIFLLYLSVTKKGAYI